MSKIDWLPKLLRKFGDWMDMLIFGRSYPNYIPAGGIIAPPFYGGILTGLMLVLLSLFTGNNVMAVYSAIALQGCCCFMTLLLYRKHFYNMPTVSLKITYFLYLAAICFICGYLFMLAFAYFFLFLILLFVGATFIKCLLSNSK